MNKLKLKGPGRFQTRSGSKQNWCFIFLFVFIILITSISGIAAADSPDGQLINVNFKGVDLRDVFRTIADLAGVNLVTDGSVGGSITLNLKDISFEEALNLITRTQQLAYRWDGNTVVVASPQRIEEIYTRIITSTIKIEHADPGQIKVISNGVYPGLNIQVDQRNSTLIIKGKEEEIREAADLIARIDLPRDTETRTIKLEFAEPRKTAELIRIFHPSLKIEQDEAIGQLIIYGAVEAVQAAVELVAKIDIAPPTAQNDPEEPGNQPGEGELPADIIEAGSEQQSEEKLQPESGQDSAAEKQVEREKKLLKTIRLKYADLESVRGQINGLFPLINVQVDRMNNQLILLGTAAMIERVEELVSMVDLKPGRILKTEEVNLEYSDPLKIRKRLLVELPDLQINTDGERGLIFHGSEGDVNQALKFIMEEDQPEEVRETRQITESARIVNSELTVVEEQLKKILPELKIVTDQLSRELLITGEEKQVRSAVLTARKIDSLNKEVTEFIQIDYLGLSKAGEILTGLYPGIRVQLNEEKRELIISGKVVEVDKAYSTAEKLNTPRRQVIIEARVEEIKVNQLKNLGLYPDKLGGIQFIKNGEGQIDSLAVNWPDAIKALEEEGMSNTLANPRLMTLNGEQAKLLIGDRIPIVVDSGENGQQIQYIDAGITLQFTPWIGKDDQITLEVSPRVSSIGESIGSSIPPVNTREAQTTIRLKDGQTFAIGGLIQDNELKSTSQVPLLAEIPIIGELFKRVDNKDIKTELIIFITPYIVQEDDPAGDKQVRDRIGLGSDVSEKREVSRDPQMRIDTETAGREGPAEIESESEGVGVAQPTEENHGDGPGSTGKRLSPDSEPEPVEPPRIVGLTIEEIEEILNREL